MTRWNTPAYDERTRVLRIRGVKVRNRRMRDRWRHSGRGRGVQVRCARMRDGRVVDGRVRVGTVLTSSDLNYAYTTSPSVSMSFPSQHLRFLPIQVTNHTGDLRNIFNSSSMPS